MKLSDFNLCFAFALILCTLSYTVAFRNDLKEFNNFIKKRCYNMTTDQNPQHTLINGQERPLSHTFENFVHLVEKIEKANTDISLNDLLLYILKKFTHENLKPQGDDVFVQEEPLNMDIHFIADLWGRKDVINNNIKNPLSDDEICSLFFMLSHAVNDNPTWFDEAPTEYAPPFSKDGLARADRPSPHPREKGIVIVQPNGGTVALSRVILGLYLGLSNKIEQAQKISQGKDIDDTLQYSYLYGFTLADILVFNAWPPVTKPMGPNVEAKDIFNTGISLFPDTVCPTVFWLPENASSMYTFSFVRGGIDGLVLGTYIREIMGVSPNLKLTQILRSYYSPRGIQLPPQNGGSIPEFRSLSHCSRKQLLTPFLDQLLLQIKTLTAILARDEAVIDKYTETAYTLFQDKQDQILPQDFCAPQPTTLQELPCETPVEVIVILDSRSPGKLDRQKQLVGTLANNLDLSHDGSYMTVLLDQLNSTDGFDLQDIIPRTSSSSEVACHLLQQEINEEGIDRVRAVQSLDKYISARKVEDRDASGVPGKVVLYFNFEDKADISSDLRNALNDFHRRHKDISVFAVGENPDLLKNFAALNKNGVMRMIDRDIKKLADELTSKMCLGPAALQYGDCKIARDERNAVYEGFVSRGAIQHWTMDAQYYEKSYTARIFFETEGRNYLKVCYHRGTSRPDLKEQNCHNTTSTRRRLTFNATNPCEGVSGFSCSSMFFSVIGSELEEKDQLEYCSDERCKSLSQVKYKVTHEGVRCSGCSGLFSSSVLLLASLTAYYIFHK